MRIELFPSNFWVIEPDLEEVCNSMKLKKIAKLLSTTVLKFCPQCYAFNLRAKVFTHQLELLKVENQDRFHNGGNEIQIRRDYIVEDAFESIFVKKINP
jgi:hypothetical protein